jgi:hypothetical protein
MRSLTLTGWSLCKLHKAQNFTVFDNFPYVVAQHYVTTNSIVGRNVLGCCQRYNTHIDSVVTCRFDIKNIGHTANTVSDDTCNRVATLSELIQCRDGMLCMSNVSFT